MSEHVNLDRVSGRSAQKSEEDPTLVGDIFEKAFSSFTLVRAEEARAAGIYP